MAVSLQENTFQTRPLHLTLQLQASHSSRGWRWAARAKCAKWGRNPLETVFTAELGFHSASQPGQEGCDVVSLQSKAFQ